MSKYDLIIKSTSTEGECLHNFCSSCTNKESCFTLSTRRYDNLGCGRSYLSQRDLEAHISYRHRDKSLLPQAGMLPPGISAAGTTIPSFPLPAFLQPGISRPDLGMPVSYPTQVASTTCTGQMLTSLIPILVDHILQVWEPD